MKTSFLNTTVSSTILSLSIVVLLASCSKETIEPKTFNSSDESARKTTTEVIPTLETPVHPSKTDPSKKTIGIPDVLISKNPKRQPGGNGTDRIIIHTDDAIEHPEIKPVSPESSIDRRVLQKVLVKDKR